MLDFLWHMRGSVTLNGMSDDTAISRIELLLAKQGKGDPERGPACLAFNDPIWRGPFRANGWAMAIFDHGRFWIDHGLDNSKLRYDLRSLHVILFCLFGALTAFFFGLAGGGFALGIKFAAGAFAWVYGMNVILALIRVPRAIRRAVASA